MDYLRLLPNMYIDEKTKLMTFKIQPLKTDETISQHTDDIFSLKILAYAYY